MNSTVDTQAPACHKQSNAIDAHQICKTNRLQSFVFPQKKTHNEQNKLSSIFEDVDKHMHPGVSVIAGGM